MKRFKSILTDKSWIAAAMASLLLIWGCGPVWPPGTGSYLDVLPPLVAGASFTSPLLGLRYDSLEVAVEAGQTGQEAAIWALGSGPPHFIGKNNGPYPAGIEEDVLYVLPSDSGATVVFVMHIVIDYFTDEGGEEFYTAYYASNVALERNADLIRVECWATGQEYEMQGEELVYLGSTETVKLRFQLELDSQLDNATQILTDANDRFGPVIQAVLQEIED